MKRMHSFWKISLFGFLFIALLVSPALAVIEFRIEGTTVQRQGESANVYVRLDNLTANDNILSIQFRMLYDSTKLSINPNDIAKTDATASWTLLANTLTGELRIALASTARLSETALTAANDRIVCIPFTVTVDSGSTDLQLAPLNGILVNEGSPPATIADSTASATDADRSDDVSVIRATTLEIVSGNNQSGTVNTALPNPLVAVVKDQAGQPMSGATVTFTVTQGGGTIGGSATASVTTDANGQAAATLTLGAIAGVNNNVVTATVQGITASVTFTASATPGTAASVSVSASPSSLTANGSSASTITATVKDNFNNLVSTETVTMTLTSGSGSIGAVTNNQNGTYTATYTAGTSTGTVTITAKTSNDASGTVNLTLSSPPPPPNNAPVITRIGGKNVGEPHSVEAESPLVLTVEATDADGDTLTYSASSLPSGASFDANTKTLSWTPQAAQVGDHTVTFTVSDGKAQSSASATITVKAKLTLSIATPSEGAVLTSLTVSVSGTTTGAASVTINGVSATLSGNTFTGAVTFTSFGAQTITAVATSTDGRQVSAGINIRLVQTLIKSVTVTGSPAKAGGQITVTLLTETAGTARFSIQGISTATNVEMSQTAVNTYTGKYTAAAGTQVTDALVTVTFTPTLGATETDASQKVTIDAVATLTTITVTGSPAKAGDEITVTAVAEPHGRASFSIAGVPAATDKAMTETNGTYVGEHTISSGENVADALVTVTFTDALGNTASQTAGTKVTIDTTAPVITEVTLTPSPIKNGETLEIRVTTEAGLSTWVDISTLDSTQPNPVALRETTARTYLASIVISKENRAENGPKPVKIIVKDAVGNTTERVGSVELRNFAEFHLSVPKGVVPIHIPLKVTQVGDEAMELKTIGDLYEALGGGQNVNFLITREASGRGWQSYLGILSRGKTADRPLTDDLGILAVMKNPVMLRLKGDALGMDGKSRITLVRGTNLVGVPLRDARLKTVSDFLRLEGFKDNVTSIIVFDNGTFKVVVQPGDAGDIPITGGQSFIITARQAGAADITGEAWENVSGIAVAAPPLAMGGDMSTGGTPVLAVHGTVVDRSVGTAKNGFRVTVKNLTTGAFFSTLSGNNTPEGEYSVTFVDATSSAARVGDMLEITVETPSPHLHVQPLRHIISADDVSASQIRLPDVVTYEIPTETKLMPNYPNPFNPETWIPYQVAKDSFVTLTIYDAKGGSSELFRWGINLPLCMIPQTKPSIGTGATMWGSGSAVAYTSIHWKPTTSPRPERCSFSSRAIHELPLRPNWTAYPNTPMP